MYKSFVAGHHSRMQSLSDPASMKGGAALAVLVFNTGQRAVLDRSLLIGRNPYLDRSKSHVAQLRLSDPSVSRRHAIIEVGEWSAHVEDLGSANGTRVVTVGQQARTLRPGQRAELSPGTTIHFGGAVSCVVEEVE